MSFFTYHMKFSSNNDIGGKNLITLKPNDTDKSTTLILPGHSKTNYGEFYNQNLMFLMEHFSKYAPPEDPTIGQIWYQPFELEILNPNDPCYPEYAAVIAGAPTNPSCGQYYDVAGGCTNGGGCMPPYDIGGYGVVDYPENDYISPDLNLDGRIMWSCEHNSWVRRRYTQKLRVYTGSLLNNDPTTINKCTTELKYPGWSQILIKFTTRPVNPDCGDMFYDRVGLIYDNVTNSNANALTNHYESLLNIHKDKTHVWNCGLQKWDILATERWTEDMYVNVQGDTMTGPLIINGDSTKHNWNTCFQGLVVKSQSQTSIKIENTNPGPSGSDGPGIILVNPDNDPIKGGIVNGYGYSQIIFRDSTILSIEGSKIDAGNCVNNSYSMADINHYVPFLTILQTGEVLAYESIYSSIFNSSTNRILTTKEYVDKVHDWDVYYSTRSVPYDNATNNHPGTDKTGRKFWDTLYRRNGALEVNNIYWRNITTDVKDHILCAFSKIFEMGFLSTPESRRANPTIFYDWVLDRDKEFFYHFGYQPVSYSANIDLIQTANYSNDAGVGGMLGYKMSINLNNNLQDYLRNELDDPNYTLHQEDFGSTGNPGKFRVLTSNPIVDAEGIARSELPQISRTTGYISIFANELIYSRYVTHSYNSTGTLTSITPYNTPNNSFWLNKNPHANDTGYLYSRSSTAVPFGSPIGVAKITNVTNGTYTMLYPGYITGHVFDNTSLTYPGTSLQLCAWDFWWMIDNFGTNYHTYSGPSNYVKFAHNVANSYQIKCFANGNLAIDTNLTQKIYEDTYQRRRIEIYINDTTTGTTIQYHIRYYKNYNITGDGDPISAPTYVSHPSSTPSYVKFMARLYAVWGYNSNDICHLLFTLGQPVLSVANTMWTAGNVITTDYYQATKYISHRFYSGYYGYLGTTIPSGTAVKALPTLPANNGNTFDTIYQSYNIVQDSNLHQQLGLYMVTSGTSPVITQSINEATFVVDSNADGVNETGFDINGDGLLTTLPYSHYKYYLRWIGYTYGVQFEVLLENDADGGYLNETGEVKCTFKLKSGSIGYSYFPANLMIKKATTNVTYQMFPTIGYKTSTNTYESIIDPKRIVMLCPDWY